MNPRITEKNKLGLTMAEMALREGHRGKMPLSLRNSGIKNVSGKILIIASKQVEIPAGKKTCRRNRHRRYVPAFSNIIASGPRLHYIQKNQQPAPHRDHTSRQEIFSRDGRLMVPCIT